MTTRLPNRAAGYRSPVTTSIALFTRDLRVHDNPVLHAATAADRCIPLFVLDDAIVSSAFFNANRAAFLSDCLADLDRSLRERGGELVVRRGKLVDEITRVVRAHDVTEIHVAADVSRYARRREEALETLGADLHVHDQSINAVPPLSLTPSGGGDHFAVFTPYFRRWETVHRRGVLRAPGRLTVPEISGEPPGRLHHGTPSPELAAGGETVGRRLMADWVRTGVEDYADLHDALADDATSHLSPHLHFGTVSVTELLERTGTASEGAQAYTRQLAWRDFHHQVLAARPDSATKDYRTRDDQWRRSDDDFEAWRDGRTGYPIVDAAMRQLDREGWMHNRARLVVASFLCKTLYLDWRRGAQHFVDLLVDCDLANNQMNWQWVAGTGTDTRPNRVHNPLAQARRYDPDGTYVKRYLPELADLAPQHVHEPWTLPEEERKALDYPAPIVDLREAADRFAAARSRKR
ncbi:cryptochrome/photolyase family protein [Lentzea californiensis]|uniref:cryptochrome/photolyase family protein n=1 Tax=Lentzea californiensis TaxID=438851 RepID=UPI002165A709|nr:deoxyribodipyrimidine photo-lyase [Lentzea californiensis]MCR3750837.1 deoxyribodipyrimidine photo-lyase [Lentzea californiensis]